MLNNYKLIFATVFLTVFIYTYGVISKYESTDKINKDDYMTEEIAETLLNFEPSYGIGIHIPASVGGSVLNLIK